MQSKTSMSDKEYMEDVMLTAKTLVGLYHYAAQESSTEGLHNQFKSNLNGTLMMQHDIYKAMEQQGWYPQQQAQQTQIDQLKTKFQQGMS